jgi:hypothetical protein
MVHQTEPVLALLHAHYAAPGVQTQPIHKLTSSLENTAAKCERPAFVDTTCTAGSP